MVRINISSQFTEDLEEISDFIGKDSPFYAKKFTRKIFSLINLISKFPNLGRIVPEKQNPNIRELIYRGYRIIYRIRQLEIDFITIFQGSRQFNL